MASLVSSQWSYHIYIYIYILEILKSEIKFKTPMKNIENPNQPLSVRLLTAFEYLLLSCIIGLVLVNALNLNPMLWLFLFFIYFIYFFSGSSIGLYMYSSWRHIIIRSRILYIYTHKKKLKFSYSTITILWSSVKDLESFRMDQD